MVDSWGRNTALQQRCTDEELGPIMVVSSRVLAHPDIEPSFDELDDVEFAHDHDLNVDVDGERDVDLDLVGEAVTPFAAASGPRVGAANAPVRR